MEPDYRDLSVVERLFGKPLSGMGWWSLALAAAFVLLLIATGISGGRPPNLLLLAALACGIASGIAGGVGIYANTSARS